MRKQQSTLDDKRWAILTSRSAAPSRQSSDNTFIYAVRTTGVYCVPGCSSRMPKRENVQFFDCTEQAKGAGFRACKRCEPDKPIDAMTETIERVCRMIEESDNGLTLAEMAKAVNLSTFHLLRQFKKRVGTTPKQYAIEKRRKRLQSSLKRGSTVTEAIYEAGYGSASRAYDARSKQALSPGEVRRGGEGLHIIYSVAKCDLGLVLIATTSKGICCIELGESKQKLLDELCERFPHAAVSEDTQVLKKQVSDVVSFIHEPQKACAPPLDIQGTAFQIRVWNELRKIPPGTTTTYSELARRVKKPAAVRAVASAVARNKIAVLIPCHRVIGKNGDICGYHWGVDRKSQLLHSESKIKK